MGYAFRDACFGLNPGNDKFQEALNSAIYVDKTALIAYTNSVIHGCHSEALFSGLKISSHRSFHDCLNQYDTLFWNMQEFLSHSGNVAELIQRLKRLSIRELKKEYPAVDYFDDADLIECLQDIYQETRRPFIIIIIDEWDCIFREFREDKDAQAQYLDFLRDILKDKSYIHLVYMTGILPIKKYGTHSALNMFDEFSMTDSGPLAEFVGFTENEVHTLCEKYRWIWRK